MMSKTAAEPLVRISKREGTTFVQKVLVRAIAILLALVRGRKQVSQGGVSRAGCAEKAAF